MPTYSHREEVVNASLAQALNQRGTSAEPETLQLSGRAKPDILFALNGIRIALEAKFQDASQATSEVVREAKLRIEQRISHLSVALLYPPHLRTTPHDQLLKALTHATFRMKIFSEQGETDWISVTFDGLLEHLRRTQASLAQEDHIALAAQQIDNVLDQFVLVIGRNVAEQFARLLKLDGYDNTERAKNQRLDSAIRIAGLTIINAAIFQEQLSSADKPLGVRSLQSFISRSNFLDDLVHHWMWIQQNIDYVPIFGLAQSLVEHIPTTHIAVLRDLFTTAQNLCHNQIALRHDLMGRVYHRLLKDAKYLGTYYTSVPAATLLLKLVFQAMGSSYDFSQLDKVQTFRIADLACGTGTLVMAAAQALFDRFVEDSAARAPEQLSENSEILHQTLIENVLYGYDILWTAIHLTATTVGLLSPTVPFRKMSFYVMPLGIFNGEPRLGSLDFINQNTVHTQLALFTTEQETIQVSTSQTQHNAAHVPPLDICVMNPPFVRSVGGNLLFGNLPEAERDVLQQELKRRMRSKPGSITAGLGSAFLAATDPHIKRGGRLAFILPLALATGEAWAANRQMLANQYHLEMVIASHDPQRVNFSENTDLSEIMFIARKTENHNPSRTTRYVNLWSNPGTIYEALDLAERIRAIPDDTAVASITNTDGRQLAEVITLPTPKGRSPWIGVQFAQFPALRVAIAWRHGVLEVPGCPPVKQVPVCSINTLGSLGFDQRDIHDAFTVSATDWSPYSAFWGHDSNHIKALEQQPNAWLHVRAQAAPGRRLKSASQVWSKASRILLAERLWFPTSRTIAIRLPAPVLSNTWWCLSTDLSDAQEKTLLLWLNSTLGLLQLFLARTTTRSAWVKFKKPIWAALPVLNVRALDSRQLNFLAQAYDSLASQNLLALADLNKDDVRKQIDNALCKVMEWPDLQPLRQLLSREPGLTAQSLSPKPEQLTMKWDNKTSKQQGFDQIRLF